MLIAFATVAAAASFARAPSWFEKNMIPGRQAAETMRSMTADPGTIVVVDANNVRGAVNFRLSKLRFTTLVEGWAAKNGLGNRVVIAWDHGLVPLAHEYRGVCHAWAGPRESADDLIAMRIVPSLYDSSEDEHRVCVVTTDRELMQRVKRAAFESGASQGRLRLLGTRKFVSLLMHATDDAVEIGSPVEVESPERKLAQQSSEADEAVVAIASGFERGETSVRRFAQTQRKLRRHERRRRRRPDGYSAPYAERTWHRVVMSEKLRRLLAPDSSAIAASDSAADKPDPVAAFAKTFNSRDCFSPRSSSRSSSRSARSGRVEPSGGERPLSAEGLLSDVRLDGKQRAVILRLGAALSKGSLTKPKAQGGAESPGGATAGQEGGGALRPRSLPTKRQRRRKLRASADELLVRAGTAGSEASRSTGREARDRRLQLEVLERQQALEGLERWLDDDAQLWECIDSDSSDQ